MSARNLVRDYPITLGVGVNGLLQLFAAAFHSPTFATFSLLFVGAVLVRGRHTVTRMIFAAGVRAAHHARFHRFFSQARWRMDDLWERLVVLLAERLLSAEAVIDVVIDDTAQAKTGGHIYGVGMVYDNRPQARKGNELRWGLTWVVATVTLRVPQWQNHVFAVPVMARLYRRKTLCRRQRRPFQTKPALAREMLETLALWLPGRRFRLHIDGGYNDGKLLQTLPPAVAVVGRLREDAALYAPRPKRARRIGRPRLHGRRLAGPAAQVQHRGGAWRRVTLPNGKVYEVQTWIALWWKVFRERPIRVVASRRPGGGPVQFFYSTELTLRPEEVLAHYADRWSIECLFHEVKERMGFEDPQCRTEPAVERTTPFLLWTAGVVECWFLRQGRRARIGWRPRWWAKRRQPGAPPSFSEMLAAMRRELLGQTLFHTSASQGHMDESLRALIESAAFAA
jgi:hypothetical protein